MTRRANAIVSLVAGFAIGIGLPFLQVWLACGAPESEACVWGKSLLPVTVSISAALFGAVLSLALFGILESRRPPPPQEPEGEQGG